MTRDYVFTLRSEGVEELRAQLRALAADGTTAFDQLAGAAGRVAIPLAASEASTALRELGAGATEANQALVPLSERTGALSVSLPTVTDSVMGMGRALVRLGDGGDVAATSLVTIESNAQEVDLAFQAATLSSAAFEAAMGALSAGAAAVGHVADAVAVMAGSIAAVVLGGDLIDLARDWLAVSSATAANTEALAEYNEAQDGALERMASVAGRLALLQGARSGLAALGSATPALAGATVAASGLLMVVTRLHLGFAAIAAVANFGVGAAESAGRAQEAMKGLDLALTRSGSAAGLTREQLVALAYAVERSTELARDEVFALQQQLMEFRSLDGDLFGPIIKGADQVARTMKVELPDALKTLAGAVADPAEAQERLAAVSVHLTKAQQDLINKLAEAGDQGAAQRAVLEQTRLALAAQKVQTDDVSGAMDESDRSAKRLAASFRDLQEAVGGGILAVGRFFGMLKQGAGAYLPDLPFSDWLAAFNENIVDALGTLPLETQLTRVQDKLKKARGELVGLKADYDAKGGNFLMEAVQETENRIALLEQRERKIDAAMRERPTTADDQANSGALREQNDRNARELAKLSAGAQAKADALLPPDLTARVKTVNGELEKTLRTLNGLRNKDGSNAAQVDAEIARAQRIAQAQVGALITDPGGATRGERLTKLKEQAAQAKAGLEQLRAAGKLSDAAFRDQSAAIDKATEALTANTGGGRDQVAITDLQAQGQLRLAQAYLDGNGAALEAQAAMQAAVQASKDGETAEDALTQALLERAAAEALVAGAKDIDTLRTRVAVIKEVAAAAAVSAAAEAEAEREIKSRAFAEEKLTAARRSGSRDAIALAEEEALAFNKLSKEEAAATRARQEANAVRADRRGMETLEAQLRLVGATREERAKELALLKLRQDLEDRYADVAEREAVYAARRVEVERRALLEGQLQDAETAAQDQQRIWTRASEGIQDSLSDAFRGAFDKSASRGKDFAENLKRLLLSTAAQIASAFVFRPVIGGALNAAGLSEIAAQVAPAGASGGASGTGLLGGGNGGSLSLGGLVSKGAGGWLDRQLGGGITSASNWLNTTAYGGGALNAGAVQQTAAGLGTGAREMASGAMPLDAGGVTYGDMIGGAGYGFGAVMNFANGNIAGGIGNAAATIMSFIPGLQAFAPVAAIAGQLLGGLFGQNRGTPTAAATVTYRDSKQVANSAATDNEGDPQQAQQLLQSIDAATAKFIGVIGGSTRSDFGVGVEGRGDRYKARTLTGELPGDFATLDEAVIAAFRKNVADGLVSASGDVLTALRTSTATDINDFMGDLSFAKDFRAQFDAMNASLDPVANTVKTFTANAKALGEQVATNILDWKDKASALGLATESELTEAARKGIVALMGLGPAVQPIVGSAAAAEQARINFETLRPTLEALGYSAAEVADLSVRYVRQYQDSYADGVALLQRQAAVQVALLSDGMATLSAADTFRAAGASKAAVAAPAFAVLTARLDEVTAAGRLGALTIADVNATVATLNQAYYDGILTAEQYQTAVTMVTGAYQTGAQVLSTIRQGWVQLAAITDPRHRQTATDVLDGAMIGGAGVSAFRDALDWLFAGIRAGTATFVDLTGVYGTLVGLLQAGVVSGEQFNGVLGAMTGAWQAGVADADAARRGRNAVEAVIDPTRAVSGASVLADAGVTGLDALSVHLDNFLGAAATGAAVAGDLRFVEAQLSEALRVGSITAQEYTAILNSVTAAFSTGRRTASDAAATYQGLFQRAVQEQASALNEMRSAAVSARDAWASAGTAIERTLSSLRQSPGVLPLDRLSDAKGTFDALVERVLNPPADKAADPATVDALIAAVQPYVDALKSVYGDDPEFFRQLAAVEGVLERSGGEARRQTSAADMQVRQLDQQIAWLKTLADGDGTTNALLSEIKANLMKSVTPTEDIVSRVQALVTTESRVVGAAEQAAGRALTRVERQQIAAPYQEALQGIVGGASGAEMDRLYEYAKGVSGLYADRVMTAEAARGVSFSWADKFKFQVFGAFWDEFNAAYAKGAPQAEKDAIFNFYINRRDALFAQIPTEQLLALRGMGGYIEPTQPEIWEARVTGLLHDRGVPGFARGGTPPVDRPFQINEEGPEIVQFGVPTRVYNANDTRGLLSNVGVEVGPLLSRILGEARAATAYAADLAGTVADEGRRHWDALRDVLTVLKRMDARSARQEEA